MKRTTQGLLAWAARRRQTMHRGSIDTGPGSRTWVAQGLRQDRAYYRSRMLSMLDLRPLYIVVADVPDFGPARYCLPTERPEAERIASELRASGRPGATVRRWPDTTTQMGAAE